MRTEYVHVIMFNIKSQGELVEPVLAIGNIPVTCFQSRYRCGSYRQRGCVLTYRYVTIY